LNTFEYATPAPNVLSFPEFRCYQDKFDLDGSAPNFAATGIVTKVIPRETAQRRSTAESFSSSLSQNGWSQKKFFILPITVSVQLISIIGHLVTTSNL
jgi:hypothetical protein